MSETSLCDKLLNLKLFTYEMKKHWKCIISFLTALLIGFLIGKFCSVGLWNYVDFSQKASPWEVFYYTFSAFGVIGTCSAVLVALAKDSIIRFFSHPNVEISLSEDDGISEEVDYEQQTPQANCYNCVLRVKNSVSVQAKTRSAVMEQIKYAEKKGKSSKEIKDYQNGQPILGWEGDGIDLPKGISKDIRLFHINAPGRSVTPSEQGTDEPHIELNGFKLKDFQSRKGYWEILYYISYDSGEHIHFKLTVEWDGTWKSRKTEMKDVLNVKLEKL